MHNGVQDGGEQKWLGNRRSTRAGLRHNTIVVALLVARPRWCLILDLLRAALCYSVMTLCLSYVACRASSLLVLGSGLVYYTAIRKSVCSIFAFSSDLLRSGPKGATGVTCTVVSRASLLHDNTVIQRRGALQSRSQSTWSRASC